MAAAGAIMIMRRRRLKASPEDVAGKQPVYSGDMEAMFQGQRPKKLGTQQHTQAHQTFAHYHTMIICFIYEQ